MFEVNGTQGGPARVTRRALLLSWALTLGLSCTTAAKNDAMDVDGNESIAPNAVGGAAGVGGERSHEGTGTRPDPASKSAPVPPAPGAGSGGAPNPGSTPNPASTPNASAPSSGGQAGSTSRAGSSAVGSAASPAAASPAAASPTAASPTAASPGAGGAPAQAVDAGPKVPVVVERPTLVVSGKDAYFREVEPVENVAAVPSASVDATVRHQTWIGFGGAFTESGWEVLSLLDEPERRRALELLFDAEHGARLVWGRVPIGADGYALDRFTHHEVPDDFALDSFSVERDQQRLIPYIEGALEFAPDLRLWALPWTPPSWMKTNGDFDRGSIIDDAEVLSAYALYLARFIEEYRALGIDIDVLQVQADPEFEFDYPSCLWELEVLLRFVRDHLIPTLLSRDVGVELWLGAFSDYGARAWIDTLMSDPVVAEHVTGFGLQWAALAALSHVVETHDWPVMQTEHKPGNFPWLEDDFDPERAPNDHGHAVESWGFIRDWILTGVNAYSAWNLVLDTVGAGLDEVRWWPKSALLVVDRDTRTLQVKPAYYVFRHLSYFVDPGAVRIGVTAAEALAFENPDGSIVTVLFNPEATDVDVALGVKGTVLEFSVPAEGWATVHWK